MFIQSEATNLMQWQLLKLSIDHSLYDVNAKKKMWNSLKSYLLLNDVQPSLKFCSFFSMKLPSMEARRLVTGWELPLCPIGVSKRNWRATKRKRYFKKEKAFVKFGERDTFTKSLFWIVHKDVLENDNNIYLCKLPKTDSN